MYDIQSLYFIVRNNYIISIKCYVLVIYIFQIHLRVNICTLLINRFLIDHKHNIHHVININLKYYRFLDAIIMSLNCGDPNVYGVKIHSYSSVKGSKLYTIP